MVKEIQFSVKNFGSKLLFSKILIASSLAHFEKFIFVMRIGCISYKEKSLENLNQRQFFILQNH